jgi:hypothetical protein
MLEAEGERLFQLICERDLEGIVAKHRESRYAVTDGNPAWIKIRNRRYSQMIGRDGADMKLPVRLRSDGRFVHKLVPWCRARIDL